MIRKVKPTTEEVGSDSQLAAAVKASAQQIWLAGLGAFAKAQEEGVKVFDALVTEGKTLHKRTRHLSDGKLDEVGSKVGRVATDIGRQATQSWDRLEQVFEERVARALSRLGVPTSVEVKALTDRVEALNEAVRALGAKPASGRKAAGPALRRTAARQTVAAAATTKGTASPKAAAKKAAAQKAPAKKASGRT